MVIFNLFFLLMINNSLVLDAKIINKNQLINEAN